METTFSKGRPDTYIGPNHVPVKSRLHLPMNYGLCKNTSDSMPIHHAIRGQLS